MKEWGIFAPTIEQFEKQGKLSESAPPFGACYWVEGEQLDRIREFEEDNDALVYFVIHSYTNIGEMESYLYVSNYVDEWKYDHEDIKEGRQLCYVYNHNMPECSEFGTIGIKRTPAAGLVREW